MTGRSSVFQLGILNWRKRCGLVVWIAFHSVSRNLSPRLSCCRHQHCQNFFSSRAVCMLPVHTGFFFQLKLPELQNLRRADELGKGVDISKTLLFFKWLPFKGVGSPSFFYQELQPSSRHSALCPLTDTNTNIIPTRGGNSFLTWMIKIFFKSMVMTSCGMGSKHNYCCCCKCFLWLYFCCTVRNWIVIWMEEVVDSLKGSDLPLGRCTLSSQTACLFSKHTASWEVMSSFFVCVCA